MRLTVTTFLTLDGVMQGPGGPEEDTSGGFARGGWVVPFGDEDMGEIVTGIFAKADAFLLGRTTYDLFASYWPKAPAEEASVAEPLNKLPKYVVTSRPLTQEWAGTEVISGDVEARIAQLKEQPGDELQVHGSGRLAQSLLAADLVDEYRLWFYPVVLGDGKRLFEGVVSPTAMTLVDTKTTGSGVIVASYQPTGPAEFGTVPMPE
jgi:dihydrofolate reductase